MSITRPLLRAYQVFRAPWIFLASWTGFGLFWACFIALDFMSSNAAESVVDVLFRPFLTLIWGNYENTLQLQALALCTRVYLPALPGMILKLIEWVTGLGKHFKNEQQEALEI